MGQIIKAIGNVTKLVQYSRGLQNRCKKMYAKLQETFLKICEEYTNKNRDIPY